MHRAKRPSILWLPLWILGIAHCGSSDPNDAQNNDDEQTLNTNHSTRSQLPVRMIVMGDSISAGVGASVSSLSYASLLWQNNDSVYPDDADSDLTSEFSSTLPRISVAVPGATTADVRTSQIRNLEAQLDMPVQGHTVVVLTAGGNDALGAFFNITGPALDSAIANIRAISEYFKDGDKYPDGVTIFIANLYDPGDDEDYIQGCFNNMHRPGMAAGLEVWNQRYLELAAEEGFVVIDDLHHFKGHGFHHNNPDNPNYDAEDPSLWFISDCIHPNDRGHVELRNLFFSAIDTHFANL